MFIHRGLRFQQGRGIGSFFSSIFRGLKPLLSMGLTTGKKIFNSDFAKKVGSTALDFGKQAATNLAVDLLEGKDMSQSVNKELTKAKEKIAETIKGGGRKGKRKIKHKSTNLVNKKFNLLVD